MQYLIILAAIFAAAWFWQAGMVARELATRLAREQCAGMDLQFLDGTVAPARTSFARRDGRMRIRRFYRFEFADREARRHVGSIALVGLELEELQLEGYPLLH